ncbi:adenine phosphoribosyltransferase [Candidatus Poribacteria bacterium]|nr:adenine phosphoribosyltransferase [Candidatus Poribacteria bacterium]MYA71013.1 adenine phosphoribosyltransferase [Candidatus Poribacteria bacterium]MYH83281.1 adenine phosphoribosyltransferase [Candidatus Poribacteria bacterium]
MQDFSRFVREVPDFPKPGILFKDITPLLGNPTAFHRVIDEFARHYKYEAIDVVAGPEARGFIFSTVLAYRIGAAFVPIRKKGKLPYEAHEVTYDLEYGSDTIEIHQDAFPKDSRVLLCDDLLATGGTLAASVELVEKLGGHIVGIAVLIELLELEGREKIPNYDVFSLMKY